MAKVSQCEEREYVAEISNVAIICDKMQQCDMISN